MASSEKDCPGKEKIANNQNWKGKKNKSGQTTVCCCSSAVVRGSCGAAAVGWDQNYGKGMIFGYGSVGGRVCRRHQLFLKLMIYFNFSQL